MQKFKFPLDLIESLKFSLCCLHTDSQFSTQKSILDIVQKQIGNIGSEILFAWMCQHEIKGNEWYVDLFKNECDCDINLFVDALECASYCLEDKESDLYMNEYPFRALLTCCQKVQQIKPKDDRPFSVLMQEFIDAL